MSESNLSTQRVFPFAPGSAPVGKPEQSAGKITNGDTVYVPLPLGQAGVGIDIQWKDATSAATITLEQTSSPFNDVSDQVAGSAWQWQTVAAVAIVGPTAASANSTKVRASNLACSRARLKIVATANCSFEIFAQAKDI